MADAAESLEAPERIVHHGRGYFVSVFLAMIVLAAIVAGAVSYRFIRGGQKIDRIQTALVALCALRVDLDERISTQALSVSQAQKFLENHPHGAFGFTANDIKVSIGTQQRTLENSRRTRRALRALECH